MISDGPCPFLTCLDTDIHAHPACPDCGAMRYGNAFCATCVRTWPPTEFRELLLTVIEKRGSND